MTCLNNVYLLLGGNLDDREAMLRKAKEEVSLRIGPVQQESYIYESEPWGFETDQRFLNQVVQVVSPLKPNEILDEILDIENGLGRARDNAKGYKSRSIDIDILFYNDEIIREGDLTIPHPRIAERMFTLVPLAQMDRDFIHPGCRKTIGELVAECQDPLSVYFYLES